MVGAAKGIASPVALAASDVQGHICWLLDVAPQLGVASRWLQRRCSRQ